MQVNVGKLTGVACSHIWGSAVYQTVCHVSKDNAHEGKHGTVGNRHDSPYYKHQNVPAIRKPELHSGGKKKVEKDQRHQIKTRESTSDRLLS